MTPYQFYKQTSLINKLLIIKSIIDLPAVLIHELCHIIVAILTCARITGIECHNFYKVSANGTELCMYNFTVYTQLPRNTFGNARHCLVNIAPIFAIFILPLINPYLIIWVIFSINMFYPSSQDITNFNRNLKSITS